MSYTRAFIDSALPHVMLDLETYGTLPTAPIRSIGVAAALPNGDLKLWYANIEVAGQLLRSQVYIGPDDLLWVRKQQEASSIQQRIADKIPIVLPKAIAALNALLLETPWFANGYYLWSRGADFDIPILRHALSLYAAPKPVLANEAYYRTRCWRTVSALCAADIDIDDDILSTIGIGTAGHLAHTALWDACIQLRQLLCLINHPSFARFDDVTADKLVSMMTDTLAEQYVATYTNTPLAEERTDG